MKQIIGLLLFFSLNAVAQNQPGHPSLPVRHPAEGQWQLTERICSSGAKAIDSFVIGRDLLTVKMQNGTYESHTRIEGCNYWATGKFEIRGNMLTVFDVVGASNCTHQAVPPKGSALFVYEADKLKIYSGPFKNDLGTCPREDLLESVFSRF